MDGIALSLVLFTATTAAAQTAPAPNPPAPPSATAPSSVPDPYGIDGPATTTPAPAGSSTTATSNDTTKQDDGKPKEPKAGDFDAGGQVRLPNGPDGAGKFAAYNWVAVDARGKYYILPSVTVTGTMPIAIIHPDTLMDGSQPKMFGGFSARLEAKLPELPDLPLVPKTDTEIGVVATVSYMHDGALLLSEKDYPRFTGNYHPGVSLGAMVKLKLSSLIDFSLVPVWVHQSAQMDALDAVQIPTSLNVRLGSLLQVSADAGVFTGPDYGFSASAGGRIYGGGSITVKIGPIVTHLGGGVASLLPGGEYPTIRDSVYLDVNVKYAK
jgi:hypothetical protein